MYWLPQLSGAAESSRQTGAASVEMYLRKGKNTTRAEM